MVDGVNFNPFTGKAWSAEEIDYVDTNDDNTISNSEVNAAWNWLSTRATQDSDAEVQIDDDSLSGAAKQAGMKDVADDASQLKANLQILQEQYIEQYCTEHPGATSEEMAIIKNLISTATTEFFNEYTKTKAQGPYQMSEVLTQYESKIDETIKNHEAALSAVNKSIDGYVNSTDANYDAMVSNADAAMENNNLTSAEWGKVKNKATQYLMGLMLQDGFDPEFFKALDPNFLKNPNYKTAIDAVNKLKTETDPIKIQQLLTTAQKAIESFLESIGRNNVTNAINNFNAAKEEAAVKEKLQPSIDQWVEKMITPDMTDEEKTVVRQIANNCITDFIEKLRKEDKMTALSDSALASQFTEFMNTKYNDYQEIQKQIAKEAKGIEKSNNNLISISDAAKESGNVSPEEKSKIVDAGVDLLMRQLYARMDHFELLANLNPNYQNTAEFKELQSVMTQINSCFDPDKIKELLAQAKEIVTKMLNAFSAEQLTTAVDYLKSINIDSDMKSDAIYNSSIGSAYSAGQTRTAGGYLDYNEKSNNISNQPGDVQDAYRQLQEQARNDMRAYAEQLKVQLKAQLGAAYDEAEIDKYINDAINDTIHQFDNVEHYQRRWGRDGNYDVPDGTRGFYFCERKRSHGRWGYDVKALIDAFTENFNKVAKEKQAAKMDPSKVTYDKENVIADSVGGEYNNGNDVQVKGRNDSTRAQLREQSKLKLQSVAAAIKASLIAEGCKLDVSVIDSLLDDAMQTTLQSLDDLMFNSKISKSWGGMDFMAKDEKCISINVATLVDRFMENFDALYQEEMGNVEEEPEKEDDDKTE